MSASGLPRLFVQPAFCWRHVQRGEGGMGATVKIKSNI